MQPKQTVKRALLVAQLVKRSPLTPEIHSLDPVIGNFIYCILYDINGVEKTKIKKKRPGKVQFLKRSSKQSFRCMKIATV